VEEKEPRAVVSAASIFLKRGNGGRTPRGKRKRHGVFVTQGLGERVLKKSALRGLILRKERERSESVLVVLGAASEVEEDASKRGRFGNGKDFGPPL